MIKKFIKFRIFQMWRKIHRQHIIIFMVHGVVDPLLQTTWRPLRRQLSVEKLDRGLALLAKHYQFISMGQAVSMLAGKVPLQPYSIVLTFDDGYRNNVTQAIPILRKYNAPATFFLSTGHVERREPFWYDRLDYAIQHLSKEQSVTFADQTFFFRPYQEEVSRSTFTNLRNLIKANALPYHETMREVNLIANSLEDNAHCRLADIFENDHNSAIMSWEEARWANGQGITIASHSVDHAILDRLGDFFIREQLTESKKIIELRTGERCLYFCYPYARWNNNVALLVRETGYVAAFTTNRGTNKVGDDLMTLHRISFSELQL